MRKTPEDLPDLHGVLDLGHSAGGDHLRSILIADRRLTAQQIAVNVRGTGRIGGTGAELKDTAAGEVRHGIHGTSRLEWGRGVVYAKITPHRMFTFHMQ